MPVLVPGTEDDIPALMGPTAVNEGPCKGHSMSGGDPCSGEMQIKKGQETIKGWGAG